MSFASVTDGLSNTAFWSEYVKGDGVGPASAQTGWAWSITSPKRTRPTSTTA